MTNDNHSEASFIGDLPEKEALLDQIQLAYESTKATLAVFKAHPELSAPDGRTREEWIAALEHYLAFKSDVLIRYGREQPQSKIH